MGRYLRIFKTLFLWILLSYSSISTAITIPLGTSANVLVVQNGNSPVSCRIAAYYMSKRNIPAMNLVTVSTPDSAVAAANETITQQQFTTLIQQPIRAHMSTNGLTDKIQYIVLTKGIPHKASGYSVDSYLAATDLVDPYQIIFQDQNGNEVGRVYINRYWRSTEPFTHSRFGGYLVTRLDGYTEADAKALVDRAMAAQSQPYKVLLDIAPSRGLGDPSIQPKSYLKPDGSVDADFVQYADYNADMTKASQVISGRSHLSVQLDTASTFVGNISQIGLYVSWGSNDSGYNKSAYNSLNFAPGGIAETAVSTSGRSFFQQTTGQSMIADLIAQGASGAKGYAYEPYLDAIASPTVLCDTYTAGRNLAESFYASSRFLAWKDVVLGDPLCSLHGTSAPTTAQAKALPNGSLVSFSGKTVTAGTDDFGNRFYIQEPDRSSGIQVYLGKPFSGINRGATVDVKGILAIIDGERVLVNPAVVVVTP